MKTTQNRVAAQGAPINQTSYAQISDSKFRLTAIVFFFLACLIFGQRSHAQNQDTLSVTEYPFEIITYDGILNQGDTATFFIHLGSASEEVENAIGFDIQLNLGQYAMTPEAEDFSIENSWLLNPSFDEAQAYSSPDVSLTGSRSDETPTTGFGELFSIKLVSSRDGVDAAALIASGGGNVMIDHIGFKRYEAAQPEKMTTTIYPNPCQGMLNLRFGESLPETVFLMDLQGQVVAQHNGETAQAGIYVGDMVPGIYLVQMGFATHREVHKLVVQ